MRTAKNIALLIIPILGLSTTCFSATPAETAARKKAQQLQKDGNWKEALAAYRELLADEKNSGAPAADDLSRAQQCLDQLGQHAETGPLVEEAVAKRSDDWRVLQQAATIYINARKHGAIIDGIYRRGERSGSSIWLNTNDRDRVRALQLMEKAMPLVAKDDPVTASTFYFDFSDKLLNRRTHPEAWRLQTLTDLADLPDYEEGWGYRGSNTGAPVDEDGNPVFYSIPESWESASNDGERLRWLYQRAASSGAAQQAEAGLRFSNFLYQQFGVQTLVNGGYRKIFGHHSPTADSAQGGTYELHTLSESETICRFANGVRRVTLPDEFNPITLLKSIAGQTANTVTTEAALNRLANIFTNRRQYPRAAEIWRESIDRFGKVKWKSDRLKQIVGNWGKFDGTGIHTAGKKATLGFVSRNADHVRFTAREVDVKKLLTDVKSYLKGNPRDFDSNKINIGQIGYRLVNDNLKKYIRGTVADWELTLTPRENHWDKHTGITTPITTPGTYLVEADIRGGNKTNIILWISDTTIVKKRLEKGVFYFVADATTGKPVGGANLEFFGYDVGWTDRKKIPIIGRKSDVTVQQFAEFTDPSGQVTLDQKRYSQGYNWLVTATTEGGRHAYHGFSSIWYNNHYDRSYDETKTLVITDRPVYRPSHQVKFKAWVRHTRYDQEDVSLYAGQSFRVRIHDPKGEKVSEMTLTTDSYGGLEGSYNLPDNATLGPYSLSVNETSGGGTFRVEEYKKPEFEVTVEAPDKPVELGKKITATVRANYYFGAPVTSARVKTKIVRTAHDARWFAPMPWDWFYGKGYWWFSYDYDWYPGWRRWGCLAPHRSWYPRTNALPEIVAENDVPIGGDGTVSITIDTSLAHAIHGDTDHRYQITAEVVDESRRTITGTGEVLVARKPFSIHLWADRGHYRTGDTVTLSACARTLDGKPTTGDGKLTLYKISYTGDRKPEEKMVASWDVSPGADGCLSQQLKASENGQYRASYTLTDSAGNEVEGGYFFVVRGAGFDGKEFRFREIELVSDKREYTPGETVKLMINTDKTDGTAVLFVRPANGVYLPPTILQLKGKSTIHEIAISKKDMPNFYVEAFTVADGGVHTAMREIVVPPEKRILDVEVLPDGNKYRPNDRAKVKVRLTGSGGKPFVGSTVVTVYDKALEYISGGSNVPDIKEFFWKWRRHHYPQTEHSLQRWFPNIVRDAKDTMGNIGIFGASTLSDDPFGNDEGTFLEKRLGSKSNVASSSASTLSDDPFGNDEGAFLEEKPASKNNVDGQESGVPVEPVVRSNFADTAFWAASLQTNEAGIAEIELDMPENLTTWKIKTWGMGHGTKVGQGEAEVITSKDLIIRLQAPRFFIEKDEVVLSANVHNYLKNAKEVTVSLDLEGGTLRPLDEVSTVRTVTIEPGGETRVDWRVAAIGEGEATVRVKALTDEESDAMQMKYPVYIHGILKTESWSGAIRPDKKKGSLTIHVPTERRPKETVLELRYSPTVATAIVDALPYLADYAYGCTEQTLNRFLPTVVVQKTLLGMGLDLAAIREKRTNLNPQETGDDKERAGQWQQGNHNPVFDEATVTDMVKTGVTRLTAMQNSDGGWGWFSGSGEYSQPHTTATVVRGLLVAKENGVALVPGILEKGVSWLKRYQGDQTEQLKNQPKAKDPYKQHADNLDAFVFMVLVDADETGAGKTMGDFLYRDRNHLSVYAKAMLALAVDTIGKKDERDMLVRNIEQFLVRDDENQTAYLDLPNQRYWWYWYGSEFEAHAYYLKLLARIRPESPEASGLVKYLVNNRKHATYWHSTRDTALCVEAIAGYLQASGESTPDLTLELFYDGKKQKELTITKDNLFHFDNKLVLHGDTITSGDHTVELRKKGTSPLYYNAYLTNFTLEDPIRKTGLEIKIERRYYRLKRTGKPVKIAGDRGQAIDQKVEKYERSSLIDGDLLKSGDLVEVELVFESKNDYEYLLFEDMKAACLEPVDVRSGYTRDRLNVYREFRDERTAFFIRHLPLGKHSLTYRLRAETPGKFSALPARASAMYAPELRANSDEFKILVRD